MIDTILYGTGALVWLAILVSAVLFFPVAIAFVVGWPAYWVKTTIEDRYYDGVEDVEAAKRCGEWHYTVSHYAFLVRDKSVAFVMWYGENVLDRTVGRVVN